MEEHRRTSPLSVTTPAVQLQQLRSRGMLLGYSDELGSHQAPSRGYEPGYSAPSTTASVFDSGTQRQCPVIGRWRE